MSNYFNIQPGGGYGVPAAAAYAAAPAAVPAPAAAATPTYIQQPTAAAATPTYTTQVRSYDTYQAAAPAVTYAYIAARSDGPPAVATASTPTGYHQQQAPGAAYYAQPQAQMTAQQQQFAAPKAFYQPQTASATPAPATYSAPASYSQPSYYAATAPPPVQHSSSFQAPSAIPKQSTVVQSNLTPVTGGGGGAANKYSGYEAALYSAATSYLAQQQQANKLAGSVAKPVPKPVQTHFKKFGGGGGGRGGGHHSGGPPRHTNSNQLFYCEICKISCGGPNTYREHLAGQKHKKKEKAVESGQTAPPTRPGQAILRCELCDVNCTGTDAYNAHIKGTKHQKTAKLHARLGKPVPSNNPQLITPRQTISSGFVGAKKPDQEEKKPGETPLKVIATPAVKFVGGSTLKTLGGVVPEPSDSNMEVVDLKALLGEKNVEPVGESYVKVHKDLQGKITQFECELCECKFNDPNARDMHVKGRRHRLAYKKKVDPSIHVDVKYGYGRRKVGRGSRVQQIMKDQQARSSAQMQIMNDMRRYEMIMMNEQMRYIKLRGLTGFMAPRRMNSSDDRHVLAKHATIHPTGFQMQKVQQMVQNVEKALKMISDILVDQTSGEKPPDDDNAKPKAKVKTEPAEEAEPSADTSSGEMDAMSGREMKGVMRVGKLAKGLLLNNDLTVHLVLLCEHKPTKDLLASIFDLLPDQLKSLLGNMKYEVSQHPDEAAIMLVSGEEEQRVTCTVTLTSPVMRAVAKETEGDGKEEEEDEEDAAAGEGENQEPDPPDVLPKQKCLDALAALRHAKWFQAKAAQSSVCLLLIRVMQDLCLRVPTWSPLSQWALELLVEKVVSTGNPLTSPGEALRRMFECISSGFILPAGIGLLDPCEKEQTDALANLTVQQREDITASAQHALRLIAFRQIHKVLGMDALPSILGGRYLRKRRYEVAKDAGQGGEKKDKKDGSKEETIDPPGTEAPPSASAS